MRIETGDSKLSDNSKISVEPYITYIAKLCWYIVGD